MPNRNYKEIFTTSFDTFKVFNKLTKTESGRLIASAPKTIWQILNHLLIWQAYQLNQLNNFQVESDLIEPDTWIEDEECESQAELEEAIQTFENQISEFVDFISNLSDRNLISLQNLKILQDVSLHLSFHLGEIILMRRMTGNYPMPHEMKNFLN
ncbi:MAG TPA: hypothetical protein VGB63_10125 [Pedobacter sp.]|jgi:uncharacterized damage-inducible protein DinB